MKVQSASELAERVAQDPKLQEEIKADPVTALANLATPLQSDTWIYRMVVAALGLVVLIAIVGAIYLTAKSSTAYIYQVPDALIALGSAAVGALAGLLAPSPRQ
jgi:hypothetical protein